MTWQDIYTILHSSSNISNLVSTRIYPILLPETPTYPAITISQISANLPTTISGKANINNPSYQVDVWDTSFSEAKTLMGYIQTAMDGASLYDSIQLNEIDLDESERLSDGSTLYHLMAEFSVWSKT